MSTRKNFYENYRQFGNALTKSFASRKSRQNIAERDAELLAWRGKPQVTARPVSCYMCLQPAARQSLLCCPRLYTTYCHFYTCGRETSPQQRVDSVSSNGRTTMCYNVGFYGNIDRSEQWTSDEKFSLHWEKTNMAAC